MNNKEILQAYTDKISGEIKWSSIFDKNNLEKDLNEFTNYYKLLISNTFSPISSIINPDSFENSINFLAHHLGLIALIFNIENGQLYIRLGQLEGRAAGEIARAFYDPIFQIRFIKFDQEILRRKFELAAQGNYFELIRIIHILVHEVTHTEQQIKNDNTPQSILNQYDYRIRPNEVHSNDLALEYLVTYRANFPRMYDLINTGNFSIAYQDLEKALDEMIEFRKGIQNNQEIYMNY